MLSLQCILCAPDHGLGLPGAAFVSCLRAGTSVPATMGATPLHWQVRLGTTHQSPTRKAAEVATSMSRQCVTLSQSHWHK